MVDEEFVNWLVHGIEESYSYDMKKRSLEADTRINKTKFSDVNAAYKEFLQYRQSDTYRNIERAKNLLSKQYEITEDNLRSAMQQNYDLNDAEYSECLGELANSKDVDVRVSLFDHKIKIKRK